MPNDKFIYGLLLNNDDERLYDIEIVAYEGGTEYGASYSLNNGEFRIPVDSTQVADIYFRCYDADQNLIESDIGPYEMSDVDDIYNRTQIIIDHANEFSGGSPGTQSPEGNGGAGLQGMQGLDAYIDSLHQLVVTRTNNTVFNREGMNNQKFSGI